MKKSILIAMIQILLACKSQTALQNANIICDGNSLTAGYNVGATENYPYQLGQLSPFSSNGSTMTSLGVNGQTTQDMNADAVIQVDALYDSNVASIVVAWEITNDLKFGATQSEAYNEFVTYCQGRKNAGFKVIVVTVIPRNPSTVPGTFETDRLAINQLLRDNYQNYADELADIASDSALDDYTDLTYYLSDGVHLNAAGYAVVAQYVKEAILRLY